MWKLVKINSINKHIRSLSNQTIYIYCMGQMHVNVEGYEASGYGVI